MLRYGFFDSEIVGYDEEGMPKFDRAESSDFLAMFISQIISDGVLAAPGDCFQVVASEGMMLKVRRIWHCTGQICGRHKRGRD